MSDDPLRELLKAAHGCVLVCPDHGEGRGFASPLGDRIATMLANTARSDGKRSVRELELEAALIRYANHNRSCERNDRSLEYPHGCDCGFDEMIDDLFPSKTGGTEDSSPSSRS